MLATRREVEPAMRRQWLLVHRLLTQRLVVTMLLQGDVHGAVKTAAVGLSMHARDRQLVATFALATARAAGLEAGNSVYATHAADLPPDELAGLEWTRRPHSVILRGHSLSLYRDSEREWA